MIIRTDYNSFILRQNPPVTLKDNPIKHLRPVRSWNVFRRVRKRLKSSAIYLIKELICLAKLVIWIRTLDWFWTIFFFEEGGGDLWRTKIASGVEMRRLWSDTYLVRLAMSLLSEVDGRHGNQFHGGLLRCRWAGHPPPPLTDPGWPLHGTDPAAPLSPFSEQGPGEYRFPPCKPQ